MGRYYNRQGIFQEGAGLREARKKDLVPSVTTIIGDTINKEFLNKWKIDRHIDIAAYNPPLDAYTGDLESYRIAIKKQFENNTTAVDFGNHIHSALEYYFLKIPDPRKDEKLHMSKSVYEEILEICKGKILVEKQVVGNGYSGTIDLLIETKDRIFIIDYKTQNKEIKKVQKYPEWIIQLAAYSMAVQRTIKKPVTCYNIIINRDLEYKFVKYSYKDLCRGKRMFKAIFKLWQDYKKFYCEVKK